MKIAIIGSGIAGLASAYFLREHECEVYEAKPFMSLAGHGMSLENGKIIDIPLRVIHPEYYPQLFSLCDELKISLRKLEHSGSFSLSNRHDKFEYFNISLFKKRFNFIKPRLSYFKLGASFMRFYYLCHKYKNDSSYDMISFGDFLETHKVSSKLAKLVLYPLLSSICTCDYEELDRFPSRVLLEMMSMIAGPVPMERFYAGTHDIENALSSHLGKLHLESKVDKIIVDRDGANLVIDGVTRKYDHIVIGTEAHVIKEFLEVNEHTEHILEDLKVVPYKTTDTIIETVAGDHDQILNEKSLHYLEHPSGGQAQASMWLNKVEPHLLLNEATMQTWNPYGKSDRELKRSSLNRALMTVDSYQAVKRIQKFEHSAFSFAGSYLAQGVPLLEGGVESARRIKERLEMRKNR